MPEGLEAEIWREAASALVGRTITQAASDERVVDPQIVETVGEVIVGVRRHGKVLLIDTTGPTIGLRFGMTGRLVVDGAAPIDRLEYASGQDRAAWDRLRLWTVAAADGADDVPAIRLNDPRRLGRVDIDPDLSALGPDMFDLDLPRLRAALRARRAGLKVTLMNQHVVAGLGNLCVDEVLFAAGLDPRLTVDRLTDDETASLLRAMRRRLPRMLRAGGSTHGSLGPEVRGRLGACPRRGCGGSLDRLQLGGRTTVWCPAHQARDFDPSA